MKTPAPEKRQHTNVNKAETKAIKTRQQKPHLSSPIGNDGSTKLPPTRVVYMEMKEWCIYFKTFRAVIEGDPGHVKHQLNTVPETEYTELFFWCVHWQIYNLR